MATRHPLRQALKKGRDGIAFARRSLVHTNLQILFERNFRCSICDFWYPRVAKSSGRMSACEARVVSDKLAQSDRRSPASGWRGLGELRPQLRLRLTLG